MKRLALILVLLLGGVAQAADPPKLTVTGGPTLQIDAPGLPVNAIKVFTPVSLGDGRILLILSTVVDGKLTVYQYGMVLGNSITPVPPGPNPPGPNPPNPPDPPTPQPLVGLAKISYDAAMQVDPAARAKAPALADAIDTVCAAVVAGKYKTVSEARSDLPRQTAAALGDQNDKWLDWAKAIAKELDAMAGGGKLAALADYRAAWMEVVRGLREVK